MKKLLFLTILIIIIAVIVFVGKQNNEPTATPTPSKNLPTPFLIDVNGKSYSALLEKVERNENLRLIPNFQEKWPSKEIILTNNCARAINGGFYTPQYKPLGLFVVKNTILGEVGTSELTNGFFWVTKRGETDIAKELPQDWSNLLFIFQTGPLVKLEGESIRLSIINDEPSRRMLVGIDKNSNVFFFTVFEEKHLVSGPYLEALPEIMEIIEKKLDLQLTDVLNLDGGTASTFYNGDFSLEELALVGSILCEKDAN